MKRFGRVILPLGVIGLLVMACQQSDAPTAPIAAETTTGSDHQLDRGEVAKGDTLQMLRRTFTIKSRLSISKVIGPRGGEIVLPGTGGRVVFPAGAVPKPLTISMSAKPGDDIVYDFEPHMVFSVPVTIVQELGATNAIGNRKILSSLLGGYFEGDFERNVTDAKHKFVKCKEVLPGAVTAEGRVFSFAVKHFSGYLASSGRSSAVQNGDDP
jgi:hypothetical protein